MTRNFFSAKAANIVAFVILFIAFSGYYIKARYGNNFLYSVGIGLAIFYLALILYWLKKADQFWYGIIEIVFAALSLFYSILTYSQLHAWNDTTYDEMLKRAALIYLIVRGLGNVHDGLKSNFFLATKIRPYWHKVRNLLFSNN